jgi:hypothetical protein
MKLTKPAQAMELRTYEAQQEPYQEASRRGASAVSVASGRYKGFL